MEKLDMENLELPNIIDGNKACHECIRIPTCVIIQNQFSMIKASSEGVENPPIADEELVRSGLMHVIAPNCKLFISWLELKKPNEASGKNS